MVAPDRARRAPAPFFFFFANSCQLPPSPARLRAHAVCVSACGSCAATMLQHGNSSMWVANLKVRFWRGGLCSLLLLTVAIASVCQVAHLLKITPLPYRVRRHFAPLLMPSYDAQLDAELAPGEVVHIGIVVPFTVRAARSGVVPDVWFQSHRSRCRCVRCQRCCAEPEASCGCLRIARACSARVRPAHRHVLCGDAVTAGTRAAVHGAADRRG